VFVVRPPAVASLVVAAALVTGSHGARADDVVAYEVEGDAPTATGDPRVAALDDGFAHAVQAALVELVPADVRAERKADLDREIVAHARLWVARFTVTRDETNDDRRQLALAVKIDRDKLRARLTELGITMQAPSDAVAAQAVGGRVALALVSVATPAGMRASFGDGAVTDLPGVATLNAVLHGAGYATARPPTHGAGADSGDVPLADAAAGAVGAEAKAELVTLAGVQVGPAVPVRGVPETAALVAAHVRVIDPRGRTVVGQGVATSAARGKGDAVVGKAIERAIGEALSDALPALPAGVRTPPGAQYTGDDTPIGEPGVVLVRMSPRTPWALVVAEQKYLINSRGVKSVSLRRMSPSGWTLGVMTTETPERIADVARKPPTTDTQPTVRIAGNIVEVSLSGAP
jgi:hypothetical protein